VRVALAAYGRAALTVQRSGSVLDLERLSRDAAQEGFSAVGRPEWVLAHRADIRSVRFSYLGPQGDGCRTVADIELGDGSRSWFTMDMSRRSFRSLPACPHDEVARLLCAGVTLESQHVPLSAAEQDRWDRHLRGERPATG
jgi:hypothetical protein